MVGSSIPDYDLLLLSSAQQAAGLGLGRTPSLL